ncbi:MAG TPA: hypothetical protein VEJ63_00945, partial [Planctomycetota bacterium]|nr:hypothetical protein [Planctomycetota bacterium]
MRPILTVTVAFVLALAARGADTPSKMVLDFEGDFPPPGSGSATSKEWKASGEQSLKINAGAAAYFKNPPVSDWTGFNTLRLSFHNPSDAAVTLGFELSDVAGQAGYWDRHQNNFTLRPGTQTLDVDFSGGLWRGETGSQYRGKIKTPIDPAKILWISINNTSTTAIYVDKIEILKLAELKLDGAFAFDFEGVRSVVMTNYTGVHTNTMYDAAKNHGFLGAGAGTCASMMYPTPMLGDGISFPPAGFRVDLPGGDYIGMIAFERGGYWGENESNQYDHAALQVNGTVVHEHTFAPGHIHFMFEDTEVTDMDQAYDKQIAPAHQISRFKFSAANGGNVFTTHVKGSRRMPLRVAGLVLAPATKEGEAFLAAHDKLQRDTAAVTYAKIDRSRRGAGRSAPSKALMYEVLHPGAPVFPGDWPTDAADKPLAEQYAITGQTLCLHLALYAKSAATVSVAAAPLANGTEKLSAGVVSHGRYLPDRPPAIGQAWIDIHHYRPEGNFSIGPDLARSVIVEFTIPKDARAGKYTSSIEVKGAGPTLSIPVSVNVIAAKLADIPIPMGVFMNAPAIKKDHVDDATYWRLQEEMIKEQFTAGLNLLYSGAMYRMEAGKLVGEDALRLIRIAEKYGPVRAVGNYGGFLMGVPANELETLAKAVKEFEQYHNLPPHYLNCYDEPVTDAEFNRFIPGITAAYKAGLRTTGYTSAGAHGHHKLWPEMMKHSYAPNLNLHEPADLKAIKAQGNHPWVYNQGADR